MQMVTNLPNKWAYVIGPYAEPVATVRVGDTFAVETADALGNRIDSPRADITRLITLPYVNPLTGPIQVEGMLSPYRLVFQVQRLFDQDGERAPRLLVMPRRQGRRTVPLGVQ